MTESLRDVILREHASWSDNVVDRAIFGTDDAPRIAGVFNEFCIQHLNSAIARAHFYRVSVACVAGVSLEDGRAVVLKAQRGSRSERYLMACFELRRLLLDHGFPCPSPLARPVRAGSAWIMAEELSTKGQPADAHDPAVRREIASALAKLEELSRLFPAPERFGRAWFCGLADERVFPTPHSPSFNFEATELGAEWIVRLAARARALRPKEPPPHAIGHFDFRIEHLRFEEGRIVASYDWDSLHNEHVPVWIGALAPHFPTDWQRDDIVRAPSLDEMRAFVSDFEVCRGRPFSREERAVLSASCVYSMSYTARCNHASSPTEEGWNGDLRPLLRTHGEELLARGL